MNPGPKADIKNAQLIVFDRTDSRHETPPGGLMVDWPGEYDRAGFVFRGVENTAKKDSVIAYVFHSPEGNIVWMGEMQEYPNEDFIEALGEVHVLIVPVGDKDVMNAKDAFKLVEELEPLVVIPMCYGDKREGLSAFIKEMDVKMPTPLKSYDLKKSPLGDEGQQMELVVLEAL